MELCRQQFLLLTKAGKEILIQPLSSVMYQDNATTTTRSHYPNSDSKITQIHPFVQTACKEFE